ncbi:unnamed protein product, partial [Cyprideis torosa]
ISATMLTFEGCNHFRQRLVLATLTGKPIRIRDIRSNSDEPGLHEFEASFLRLLDKLTNGTVIKINETGTTLTYQPGLLIGGKIDHSCCVQRSIGYYVEPLLYLGPFCKKPLDLTLHGVTNDDSDPSVDFIRQSFLPVIKRFVVNDEGLDIQLKKRGLPPAGGGEVKLTCPVTRSLRPVQDLDPGKIKRIRGVAFATRVSPSLASRVATSAKGVLLKFIPDVYIVTDYNRGEKGGKSPGFGISLVAESTTGASLSAEGISNPAGSEKGPTHPEELGERVAYNLLEEVYRGGCVDSVAQSLALTLMAFGAPDISKIIIGPLTPH